MRNRHFYAEFLAIIPHSSTRYCDRFCMKLQAKFPFTNVEIKVFTFKIKYITVPIRLYSFDLELICAKYRPETFLTTCDISFLFTITANKKLFWKWLSISDEIHILTNDLHLTVLNTGYKLELHQVKEVVVWRSTDSLSVTNEVWKKHSH
jgi:hypothetical protein